MKSSCPFCSKRYSSSANFHRHLRTIHPLEADEWVGNEYSLLELVQPAETPDDTDESPKSIPDCYSEMHYDSESDTFDQDLGNNSALESESYFVMEEAGGDSNGHMASTTVYEGLGSNFTAQRTTRSAHRVFFKTHGTHFGQHTSSEWHATSHYLKPHRGSTASFYTLLQVVASAPTAPGGVLSRGWRK